MPRQRRRPGSLTAVGCGIDLAGQTTLAARGAIEAADVVLYVVNSAATVVWIESLNRNVRSLHDCYREGEDRRRAYRRMVERILAKVRAGNEVCAVFYGHPGVFVWPSHEAIRIAREEGYPARMLPGISAEDCLFADLGFDPGRSGCQSHEATDFLLRRLRFDPTSALLLWQVGTVGDLTYHGGSYRLRALPLLVEALAEHYPRSHPALLYRASEFPVCPAQVRKVTIGGLVRARPHAFETLYVPALPPRRLDPAVVARLGLSPARDRRRRPR